MSHCTNMLTSCAMAKYQSRPITFRHTAEGPRIPDPQRSLQPRLMESWSAYPSGRNGLMNLFYHVVGERKAHFSLNPDHL